MEITPFTVYLISRLTPLYEFVTALCVVSVAALGVGSIAFLVMTADSDLEAETQRAILRWLRWMVSASIVFGALMVAIPSTKDAAAMVVLPRIANSQSVRELGDAVVELAKAWCEELRPKKDEDRK